MPNPVTPAAAVHSQAALTHARRFRFLPALAAIGAVVLCVVAGNWQRDRMNAKEALRVQFDAAARAEPVSLADLASDSDWTLLRYRPVVATGVYDAARQALIDNKVHAGRAGYHVVTPMTLADGRRVLVNRGWVPAGASRENPPASMPPAGPVSVPGRLAVPPSGYVELATAAPVGPVWQNLDPVRMGAAVGVAYLPVVVEATTPPSPDDGLVRDWPPPDFGIAQHRIYMVQWYTFALLAGGLGLWFYRPRRGAAANA